MIAWLCDEGGPTARAEALGDLPAGVTVEPFPADPRSARAGGSIERVEFVVPAWEARDLHLDALPALRVVQVRSAGVDWIVDQVPPGVTLCSARGARDAAMAEWVVWALLAAAKQAAASAALQAQRRWAPVAMGDLRGARVLVLGHGSIGEAVEEHLAPFAVEIVRVARRARDGVHAIDELDGLLGGADAVVDLLPATPATRGLLDARRLGLMRRGALLVNAGRGMTVDTDALVDALHAGHVRAVLDVVEPEPLPAGHRLWTAPNVTITPHSAGDTPGAERAAWSLVGEQLRRYVAGEPLDNVVGDY